MRDAEHVKRLLAADYRTHLLNENPYPDLKQLIAHTEFDFLSGEVLGQRDNGEPNRDGLCYQFFPAENKRILVHRFIVAVALGKWPPRDLDVHHLNSRPNDNRPMNLELVTRRDNNAARRVPLKDVADFDSASKWAQEIPKIEKNKKFKNNSPAISIFSPERTRQPEIGEVLKKYYSVPEGVSWTGRRKGERGCYHEATDGTWYYVGPEA